MHHHCRVNRGFLHYLFPDEAVITGEGTIVGGAIVAKYARSNVCDYG